MGTHKIWRHGGKAAAIWAIEAVASSGRQKNCINELYFCI